jgi:hypothetical protein
VGKDEVEEMKIDEAGSSEEESSNSNSLESRDDSASVISRTSKSLSKFNASVDPEF